MTSPERLPLNVNPEKPRFHFPEEKRAKMLEEGMTEEQVQADERRIAENIAEGLAGKKSPKLRLMEDEE